MGARGFHVFKKLRKLKMKTRQYDTDEAGDYGDAVLCFSKYCIILGLVTKLRWQLECLQRNAETQSQRIQQTSGYMDFILL